MSQSAAAVASFTCEDELKIQTSELVVEHKLTQGRLISSKLTLRHGALDPPVATGIGPPRAGR
jgi:hypothetical protein